MAGIVVMSCCVVIILGIVCIAVNIFLTGSETYDTRCMSKMTAVYCVECIEVGLPGI